MTCVMSKRKMQKNKKKLLTFPWWHYIIGFALWKWRRILQTTGCGSAWLERLVWDQEVAGSNTVTPIDYACVVQW